MIPDFFNKITKTLNEERQTLVTKSELLQINIDNIDLTQEQRITKVLGHTNMDTLKSADIDTDKKKEQIETLIDTISLDAKDKKLLKRETESFINKTHGTQREESAIEIFEKRFDIKLDTSQKFYKKKIETNSSSEWYIGGKVDGLFIDPEDPQKSFIVEVKNRTKGFFSSLREYEKTQIQLYMYMLNLQYAKLVEKYNEKIRITLVYRDQIYIDQIMSYLDIFINAFENKFLNNQKLKSEYVCMNEDLKKITLRKLYLNDINIRLNEYILQTQENDSQDCMIDDATF